MISYEKKAHIVVVEDELLMRELLLTHLTVEEYLVTEVNNAAMLEKIFGSVFNLLFLDIKV
jgi:CheY-like chemotaxis protein